MMDSVKKYRSLLIENAVAEDEAMLEKYFEVGEEGLSVDEIKQAIRSAVLTGKFYAVTGGDGRGVIVEKVLVGVSLHVYQINKAIDALLKTNR
jgi:elongation factor G